MLSRTRCPRCVQRRGACPRSHPSSRQETGTTALPKSRCALLARSPGVRACSADSRPRAQSSLRTPCIACAANGGSSSNSVIASTASLRDIFSRSVMAPSGALESPDMVVSIVDYAIPCQLGVRVRRRVRSVCVQGLGSPPIELVRKPFKRGRCCSIRGALCLRRGVMITRVRAVDFSHGALL
jgi:hypothetical protein